VKVLALPVLVPLVVLAVVRKPSRRAILAAVGGALVVVVAFVIGYAGALGDIWHYSVAVHQHGRSQGASYGSNVSTVAHMLDFRTPLAWLVVLGAAATVWLWLDRRGGRLLALWLWALVAAGFLVYTKPLLDHHSVALITPLAIAGGTALGAVGARAPKLLALSAAVGVLALLSAAWYQEHRRLGRNDVAEPAEVLWAANVLRERTRPADLVVTDLPIVAHLAGRVIPGEVIDTSIPIVLTHELTAPYLVGVLKKQHVQAVVVARLFLKRPDILAAIRPLYRIRLRLNRTTVYLGPTF
jgi:hypothetical protein